MISQEQYDYLKHYVEKPEYGAEPSPEEIGALLASFQEVCRALDGVNERFQTGTEEILYDEDGNPRLEL